MRTDLKKCGAHNLIHGDRETCPKCVETARARLHAQGVARVEEHQKNRRIPGGIHVEVSLGFATPSAEEIQEAFQKSWKGVPSEDILADLDRIVGTLAEQNKAGYGPAQALRGAAERVGWIGASSDLPTPREIKFSKDGMEVDWKEVKELRIPAEPRRKPSLDPFGMWSRKHYLAPAVKALLGFFTRLAGPERTWTRERNFDWSPARRGVAELAGYPPKEDYLRFCPSIGLGQASVAGLRRRLLAGETLTRMDMPLGVTLTQAVREVFPGRGVPNSIASAVLHPNGNLVFSYDSADTPRRHPDPASLRRRLLDGETMRWLDMPVGVDFSSALREALPERARHIPSDVRRAWMREGVLTVDHA
jgi:hypothetical protein